MFNNVALDVFIGLIFIYLLYSLLATIVMEFISHYMALRARMLVKALRRMLEDNPKEIFGIKKRWTAIDVFSDFRESIKRFFFPFRNLPFLYRFYHHPTIKYLGESKSSSKPSYMTAENFTQTLIQILRGRDYKTGQDQLSAIEKFIFVEAPAITHQYNQYKYWILNRKLLNQYLGTSTTVSEVAAKLKKHANNFLTYKPRKTLLLKLADEISRLGSMQAIRQTVASLEPLIEKLPDKISPETLQHFQNLFKDAQYNFNAFKERLETWYNETMQRASGWYKRQTQVILLLLGLGVAIIANVDTIRIYKLLAKDKKTRDQIVNMAIESQQKYAPFIDTLRSTYKDSMVRSSSGKDSILIRTKVATISDTLLDQTYKALQEDAGHASAVLGLGWCNSDSCKHYQHAIDSLKAALDTQESKTKRAATKAVLQTAKKGYHKFRDRWNGWNLIGWLITALAISLGAPFWFDLLNKVTRIRATGIKETTETDTGKTTTTAASAPLSVTVNSNTNPGEEAVG